ncbi:18618_t:CDS:2 [Gigaspora margarita]|uniref:18618_t:CDS:1 n=1 Tax=Gigaspora margarita TaxID=4874 RepID=A0ABM8W418_GIGMA|nr:18618_t:CDS:2 [Gigaspora margarita]
MAWESVLPIFRDNLQCGAQVTYANLLPDSKINTTVQSPDYQTNVGTSAIGHFSMKIDNNKGWANIPLQYNFQWDFDLPIPPQGTWFDVWIPIYWDCFPDGISTMSSYSEDVHYRSYVK